MQRNDNAFCIRGRFAEIEVIARREMLAESSTHGLV